MTFQLALCSEVYDLRLEETIRQVADLGFDGLEIAPFNLAESVNSVSAARRQELRSLATRAGLPIIGLHWLLVSPTGLHLTTPDEAVRRRTIEYLMALARCCADLGGTFLVLGSPKQRSVAPGEGHDEARKRAAEGLRSVAEVCGQCGVRLLLEPLNPAETNFLITVEEALELKARIDHPSVGYILDCKALSGMPAGIVGTIAAHGKEAGHFHANEPSGLGPGMGTLDFAPILQALGASGYSGWVSTEPFIYKPDSQTVARTAIETLRRAQLPARGSSTAK